MKASLLLLLLFLFQNLVAQEKLFYLFDQKSEKKALKWVIKNPNQMIDLKEIVATMETNQYAFYSESCRVDEIHPFELASYRGLTTIIDFYLGQKEFTSNIQLLSAAYTSSVHLNDMGILQKFIDAGVVNSGTCNFCRNANALQIALGNDDSEEIVDLFYKSATDEEFLYEDCKKYNVLINATSYENSKYFQNIIKRFPKLITKIADDGFSALSFAIISGNTDKVRFLLDRIDKNDLAKIIEGFSEKNNIDFIGLAVESENSEMIDLILEKKLGFIHAEFPDYLSNNFEIEYYDYYYDWVNELERVLKHLKKLGYQDAFLKEQLKYVHLPEETAFIQKYVERKVADSKLNDEFIIELRELYEIISDTKYAQGMYRINSIRFEKEDDFGYSGLLNVLPQILPYIFQLELNTRLELLASIESHSAIFENVKFLIIHDSDENEIVNLPSNVFLAERITIISNGETIFNFPDFKGNERTLTKVFVKNALVKNIPEEVTVVNLLDGTKK